MEKKIIYLDHAATTATRPEVVDAMLPYFTENFWNPSSVYTPALNNRKVIDESRDTIAKSLGTTPENIYFTAGGSESDNWALKCTAEAYASKGKHIITSKIEHHAILHTCEYLEKRGFEITYIDVDENGILKLDDLKAAIRPDTILISVMFANNEIGTIQPIKEIGAIAKEHGIIFHTDAVQAYAQIPINVDEYNIDMLSVSGHKIHAPKGTGFLFIKDKTKVKPLIYGGGQQKGMRSGTENVPGVAALGEAAEEIYENFEEKIDHLYQIKQRFVEGVLKIEGVSVNGKTGRDSAPQIVSVSIDGVRSEVMLHTLEDRKIYVSAGSACSSNKPSVSHTLTNIGLKGSLLDSTIRFSFSVHTTEEEIDYALEVMNEVVPKLRRYTRK